MQFKSLFFGAVVALGCSMVQCVHAPKERLESTAQIDDPSTKDELSREEALLRSAQVEQVGYKIFVDLTSRDRFFGKTEIHFVATHNSRDIRIDLEKSEISRFKINGVQIAGETSRPFLMIPKEKVVVGANRIEIEYARPYSNDGHGLHQFVDPEDKSAYVWTQFEPFFAHLLFPCFDQPDIKATYTLTVQAPKEWIVTSSSRENRIEPAGRTGQIWTFSPTPKFSTYLFSLHAGPFHTWTDTKFRIPLRLLARKSLAKYVDPNVWFETTRRGFTYFENYFGVKYPFGKYDQIIVPEASFGAMENVAAVTFNEYLVRRGQPSLRARQNHANIIYHEMAHMWFGNLVTMKWWNDLWLNETFATFMATMAAANDDRFGELAWHQGFLSKSWGMREDSYSTTHPVVGVVRHTGETLQAFDGITYNKGAALIKQLHFWLGAEGFKSGIRNYFTKYSWKNTEYKDFLSSLGEATGKDVTAWGKQWFETSGYNSVGVDLRCSDKKVQTLKLNQRIEGGTPLLRNHAFQVGLFKKSEGELKEVSSYKVVISQSEIEIEAARGEPCPDFVFPNLDDYGYFSVRLDSASLANIKGHVSALKTPMLRTMVWQTLWDQVRSGELGLLPFLDLVIPDGIERESNTPTMTHLLGLLQRDAPLGAMDLLQFKEGVGESEKAKIYSLLDQTLLKVMKENKEDSDLRLGILDSTLGLISTPSGLSELKNWLRAGKATSGLNLDQDRRWSAIATLVHRQDPEAKKFLAAEEKRDRSSRGIEVGLGLSAALNSLEGKRAWVTEFMKEKPKHSLAQFRSVFMHLFPLEQEKERREFAPQFFKDLQVVNSTKPEIFASTFTYLSPRGCSSSDGAELDNFVKTMPPLKASVRKALLKIQEDGARCRKIISTDISERESGSGQSPL